MRENADRRKSFTAAPMPDQATANMSPEESESLERRRIEEQNSGA